MEPPRDPCSMGNHVDPSNTHQGRLRHFPGGLVVKTLHFHYRGTSLIPDQGIKICMYGLAKTKTALAKAVYDQGFTEGKAQAKGKEMQGSIRGVSGLDRPLRTRISAAMGGSKVKRGSYTHRTGGRLSTHGVPALMVGTARERECPMSPSSIPRSVFEHLP